jgi:hypothetical protein
MLECAAAPVLQEEMLCDNQGILMGKSSQGGF